MPIVAGIPSPKDIIGYNVGAPKKLTYYADQLKYYRARAAATPRVKVETIGRSDEGRELVVVWVTSDANMKKLPQNRANLGKIADPRGASDALGFAFNLRHDALDQVRGVARAAQGSGEVEAMQRARFLHAFLEAARGRLVEDGTVVNQAMERAFRIRVTAVRVRGAQRAPPEYLRRLREVAQDVLPRVPLATRYDGVVTKHVAHRRAQPLRAVEHDQQSVRRRNAAFDPLAQERRPRALILSGRLHEAQEALLTLGGDAQRDAP